MLKDIPDHIWIIVALGIVVLLTMLVVAFFILLRGKVRLRYKGTEILGAITDDSDSGQLAASIQPRLKLELQCMTDISAQRAQARNAITKAQEQLKGL